MDRHARPASSRAVPRPLAWLVPAFVLVLSLLSACGVFGGPPSNDDPLVLEDVRATSATSFRLRFSRPLGAGADDPANYRVRDPDRRALPVVAAHPVDGGLVVILTTEPQREVAYTVTVRGVEDGDGTEVDGALEADGPAFGSAVPAPYPSRAVPLSATRVLVGFADPASDRPARMNDDALLAGAYRAADPALLVRSVAFADDGADRSHVVLETSTMAEGTYALRVGPVTADPGARPVDPFRDRVAFDGMAAVDDVPPTIHRAYAADPGTVVALFSEPLQDGATDPDRYALVDPDGTELPVAAAELRAHGTEVALTTATMTPETRYTLRADGLLDLAGNPIDPTATAGVVLAAPGGDVTPPRLTGAVSTSPTRVLVTFSEAVRGGSDGAENPEHYEIVGGLATNAALSGQAILSVQEAVLADDGRSVTLTTLAQSDIEYTLRATGIRDLAGNPLARIDRDNPFEVRFFGTAATGAGVDSDGDGLTDAAEQRGWTVTVREVGGATTTREVTSDPLSADTDDDGVGDAAEMTNRSDPRSADTDQDDLTDDRELNVVYSSPTDVDSDDDGLGDGLEVEFFGTSPLYADTDGDQFPDEYEVTTDNRNPRIADLPEVRIDVGNVDLQLDVRFEEQTRRGTSTVDATTVSTTLERSESSRTENVQSDADEWYVSAQASICWLAGCDQDTFAWGGSVTAGGGFTRTSTTTATSESVRASQEAYARSLATEATVSAESSIRRIVEDASLAVAVTLGNPGDVAYTVRDIELTALTQDGRDTSTQVPVATLVSETGGGIGIGPLNPTRGPFRFVATEAFPSLVEQLMQNPRGITFKVANYTLEDEFGRRFAFVQQDVNDRTASFKLHYAGRRDMEIYRVATNAGFGPDGRPTGTSMASVLEDTLGLAWIPPDEDEQLDEDDPGDAAVLESSYSTRVVGGVEVLYRVRDVSRELTGEERDWRVMVYEDGDTRLITPVDDNPGEDFRSVTVTAETEFGFYFVQDLDDDAMPKSIEATYGSVDSDDDACDNALFGVGTGEDRCPGSADGEPDSRDSDRDGLEDYEELEGPFDASGTDPWQITFDDGRDGYRTSANPARRDTDGDGLLDCQELAPPVSSEDDAPRACADIVVYLDVDGQATLEDTGTELAELTLPSPTDPAAIDTDGDGLSDLQEVLGFRYEGPTGTILEVRPDASGPATNPLSRDSDDDGLDDLSEIRLGTDPNAADGDTVFDDDGDGLVNIEETTPRSLTVRDGDAAAIAGDDASDASTTTTTSDPELVDSDDDGLTDWEELQGCRDADGDLVCDVGVPPFGPTANDPDTDGDGLSDLAEVDGVSLPTPGGETSLRYPDPVDGDSDDDGLSDGAEVGDPWQVVVAGRGGYLVWSDPMRADADGDGLDDGAERSAGTDPNLADTDGDGALDGLEVARTDADGAPLTDPLTPDHLVTVTFLSIEVGRGDVDGSGDGDAGADDAGDFEFDLGVVYPDPDTGLLRQRTTVTPFVIAGDFADCGDPAESICVATQIGEPGTYLQVNSQGANVLSLAPYPTRFAVPFTSQFAVFGEVREIDDPFPSFSSTIDQEFSFGGLSDTTATFNGKGLAKGTNVKVFTQTVDQEAYRIDVTVQATIE
jgi:hypothetical protein